MSGYMQEQGGGGSESVVVNGTVEGVEIKPNGRFVVKVREIGSTSNYALNLNTKEQALAQQMMSAIGQSFSFICGLSHWTNQSGQPVTSKWINGIAPFQGQPQQQGWPQQGQPQQTFTPQPQQQAPQPTQQQGGGGQAWGPDTIRRVSWLAALEPAIAMLDFLPEEQRGVPAVLRVADFFAKQAIIRGEIGFPQDGHPTQPQPQPSYQGGGEYDDPGPQQGDPGQSYDDDSIPF